MIVGIFMLSIAIIFEFTFIAIGKEDPQAAVIALIVGNLIMVLPIGFLGISNIYSYFHNGKRLKNALNLYGKENIIANIQNSTISEYYHQFSNNVVYFTDKFIIDPGETIIDYNEISMMYKHVTRVRNAVHIYLAFELLDGETCMICHNIVDGAITNYMELCQQHNPNILFGYNDENKAKHAERVEAYKQGRITVPRVDFNASAVYNQPTNGNVNINQIRDFIIRNYTYMEKDKAINYYRDMMGVTPAEASVEVDKILAERAQNTNEAPAQWKSTPSGKKYKWGKALFIFGIINIVGTFLTLIAYVVTTGLSMATIPSLISMGFWGLAFGLFLIVYGRKRMRIYAPRQM